MLRCGWEGLGGRKHSTQSQQNIKVRNIFFYLKARRCFTFLYTQYIQYLQERWSRGSLPWLNLMSVSEGIRANSGSRLGRSLPRLDQHTAPFSLRQTRQEWLQLDIDQILEAPLELRPAEREPWLQQPFIQTEFSHSVLPQVHLVAYRLVNATYRACWVQCSAGGAVRAAAPVPHSAHQAADPALL